MERIRLLVWKFYAFALGWVACAGTWIGAYMGHPSAPVLFYGFFAGVMVTLGFVGLREVQWFLDRDIEEAEAVKEFHAELAKARKKRKRIIRRELQAPWRDNLELLREMAREAAR